MNRQQKEQSIDALHAGFSKANAAYVVGYKGLPVCAIQALRKQLRISGGDFKVAKMRLVRRAIGGESTLTDFAPFLKEQRAVVFAMQEPTAVAKILFDFAKKNEAFQIIGGYFEREVCDKDTVQFIAMLPSREVLLAQLVGTMQAPISQCVGLCSIMIQRLVITLAQVVEKKQKES